MTDYNKPILDEKGNPVKLLEVAAHHCIRCIKKTRALRKIGYEIHGMGSKVAYGTNEYETYTIWQSKQQLQNAVANYIKLGVRAITWDNEPHQPAAWIREVINAMDMQDKVRLLVDCHDLEIIRRGFSPPDELEMLNAADGLIYVSEPIQKYVNKILRISVPTIQLYSYCNKDIVEYDKNLIPNRQNLVYEGGANPPNEVQLNTLFPYRDIHDILKKIIEMGNEVHMYCGNLSAYETFQNMGAVVYPPTDYDDLMPALTKYKYGIVVFNNKDGKQAQVNLTLTNKMFEYLMAGLPSLACWCPETEKYVDKHNIGFTFDDISGIGDTSHLQDAYLDIMKSIKKKRKELVMENYIWKIENLFAQLLKVNRKEIPEDIYKLSVFEYGNNDIDKLLYNG